MEITRNQYYLAGLVLLLLGIQFRMIDTVKLNDKFAQFLAEQSNPSLAVNTSSPGPASVVANPMIEKLKTFQPPEWIGWSLVSVGIVLVLHSWAMPKPTG